MWGAEALLPKHFCAVEQLLGSLVTFGQTESAQKWLICPKFGGGAAPLSPTPMLKLSGDITVTRYVS